MKLKDDITITIHQLTYEFDNLTQCPDEYDATIKSLEAKGYEITDQWAECGKTMTILEKKTEVYNNIKK